MTISRSVSGRPAAGYSGLNRTGAQRSGATGAFSYVPQNTYVPEAQEGPLTWASRPRRSGLAGSRIGKVLWWGVLLLGVCLVVVLFGIKARALEAKAYVRQLQHELDQERAAVQMLRAEIAHLESPARLQKLSAEFLDQDLLRAEQIYELSHAMAVIPVREQALNSSLEQKRGGR